MKTYNDMITAFNKKYEATDKLELSIKLKEKELEKVYLQSTLPNKPDVPRIRELLLNCLEQHYGDLSQAVSRPDQATTTLKAIKSLLDHYDL